MSFFNSFIGTCRGTEVFVRLREVSLWKAFFHLFLLILLCAFFVGCGEYFLNQKKWKYVETLFREQFGDQLLNVGGVWRPAIAPQNSRSLQLPMQSLLLYVSSETPVHYSKELFLNQRTIILWAPGCLGTAAKMSENRWILMNYLPSGQLNTIPEQFSEEKLCKQLEAAALLPAGRWPEDGQTLESRTIFDMLRGCYAVILSVGYALNSFVMILMDTLCFALIFRIFNNRRQEFLTFAELWKIGIYAAFPVLAAVTALPALQLPLTAYSQTIFMIGWMIYLLVILYTLRNRPKEISENGEK